MFIICVKRRFIIKLFKSWESSAQSIHVHLNLYTGPYALDITSFKVNTLKINFYETGFIKCVNNNRISINLNVV